MNIFYFHLIKINITQSYLLIFCIKTSLYLKRVCWANLNYFFFNQWQHYINVQNEVRIVKRCFGHFIHFLNNLAMPLHRTNMSFSGSKSNFLYKSSLKQSTGVVQNRVSLYLLNKWFSAFYSTFPCQ